MSSHSFAKRYRDSLFGVRSSASSPPAERVHEGYGLWHRYWTSLLGFRLRKPATDAPSHAGPDLGASDDATPRRSRTAADKATRMSLTMAPEEAVRRHSWVSKKTGWLPRLGELDDPVQLGVHPAEAMGTSVAGAPDRAKSVPVYVPRDIDTQLDAAISRGGLVLVVGDSATGKSRAAYEAMRRLPQSMWLLLPRSPESLRELVNSGVELRDTVVWLDDFERYLGSRGLDVGLLHSLVGSGTRHVVVLATMRASEYFARAPGRKQSTSDEEHNLRRERQLLDQGQWVYTDRSLSRSEYQRATELASDPLIASLLRHHEEGWGLYSAVGTKTVDSEVVVAEWHATGSKQTGGKFVLKRGSSGKYHFNLVAATGQVIATSEAYEHKQSALHDIESVKENAPGAEVEDST